MNQHASVGEATLVESDAPVPKHVLDRVRSFPSLAPHFAQVDASTPLRDVPILTKADFVAARADLIAAAADAAAGALVLGSGGTTSAPKLSVMPASMFVRDILHQWSPIGVGDVVVNANRGGDLGSMYPFFAELCHQTSSVHVPLGAMSAADVDTWLDFMIELGVTALAGTPTALALILSRLLARGVRIPTLTKLLWTGEAFSKTAAAVVAEYGCLDLWGVYGSTETWVLGTAAPACPLGVFHALPHHILESIDGAMVVTTVHADCINPILRYRVGDLAQTATCSCTSPIPAFRVRGRADDQIKFMSILFDQTEPYDAARAHPAVDDAQIVMHRLGTPTEWLEVCVTVNDPEASAPEVAEEVRDIVLTRMYRLAHELSGEEQRVVVRVVPALAVNSRTMKTPMTRWEAV